MCWWCNSGRRQSRHHLFTERRAYPPPDQEVIEDQEGLGVEAPKGAISQVAMGSRGYDGCFGVSGGHQGGMQVVYCGSDRPTGEGQGSNSEREEGGPGPP